MSGLTRVVIEVIPHAQQRYETVGDWQFKDETLFIKVSDLGSWRAPMCVAVHELVEALLAKFRGIAEKDVDAFDMSWQPHGEVTEPGDDVRCPVYNEHQFASGIERLLVHELRLHWPTYEAEIDALSLETNDA